MTRTKGITNKMGPMIDSLNVINNSSRISLFFFKQIFLIMLLLILFFWHFGFDIQKPTWTKTVEFLAMPTFCNISLTKNECRCFEQLLHENDSSCFCVDLLPILSNIRNFNLYIYVWARHECTANCSHWGGGGEFVKEAREWGGGRRFRYGGLYPIELVFTHSGQPMGERGGGGVCLGQEKSSGPTHSNWTYPRPEGHACSDIFQRTQKTQTLL